MARIGVASLLLAAAAAGVSAFGPFGGVNEAGFDFTVYTNGSFTGPGTPPPTAQFQHFASQGVNLFRIPFAWQEATPSVGGNLDQGFLSRYDPIVNAALATGAHVIVDLHNYARFNGQIINQGGPTNAQYASLWSQLATHFKSQDRIIFGIMNEPHDLPNNSLWPPAVQAAVNAIRQAGATSQTILIPGSSWSSAQALPTELGPALLTITDPAGGTDKLVFDVHKYLDADNSGTHTNCVTDNVAVLQTLNSWLSQNGRQALLSETGGGRSDASCFTALNNELAFVKNNPSTFAGFAVWSAGAFDTTYELSVTPNPDGTDAPLWINAVKPNLPGATSTTTASGTSTGSAPGPTQTKFGQCGGQGYSGPTVCASGSTCKAVSPPYYSQCL